MSDNGAVNGSLAADADEVGTIQKSEATAQTKPSARNCLMRRDRSFAIDTFHCACFSRQAGRAGTGKCLFSVRQLGGHRLIDFRPVALRRRLSPALPLSRSSSD